MGFILYAVQQRIFIKQTIFVNSSEPLVNDRTCLGFHFFLSPAADIFKFVENGRKFSKWEEKTVGKGEIAC